MKPMQPADLMSPALETAISKAETRPRSARIRDAIARGLACGLDEARLINGLERFSRENEPLTFVMRELEDMCSGEQAAQMMSALLELPYESALDAMAWSTEDAATVRTLTQELTPVVDGFLPIRLNDGVLEILLASERAYQSAKNYALAKRYRAVFFAVSLRTLTQVHRRLFTDSGQKLRDAHQKFVAFFKENGPKLKATLKPDPALLEGASEVEQAYIASLLEHATFSGASDLQLFPLNDREGLVRIQIDKTWTRLHELPFGEEPSQGPFARIEKALADASKIRADSERTGLMADGKLQQQDSTSDRLRRLLDKYLFRVVRGSHVDRRATYTLRIQDQANDALDLNAMSIDPADILRLRAATAQGSGLILAVGPTGQGKTTLLYALLRTVNQQQRSIQTVERPVEYTLRGAMQYELAYDGDEAKDLHSVLRGVMRNAPNVMLVGEIRDSAVAEAALQFSLTGHLVLSSLHADSVAGALQRLERFGLESSALASQLTCLIATRLVRRLCAHCKFEDTSPTAKAIVAKHSLESAMRRNVNGCQKCRQRTPGYAGLLTLYEAYFPSSQDRSAMRRNVLTERDQLISDDRSLLRRAVKLLEEGSIDIEELMRVVPASDVDKVLSW